MMPITTMPWGADHRGRCAAGNTPRLHRPPRRQHPGPGGGRPHGATAAGRCGGAGPVRAATGGRCGGLGGDGLQGAEWGNVCSNFLVKPTQPHACSLSCVVQGTWGGRTSTPSNSHPTLSWRTCGARCHPACSNTTAECTAPVTWWHGGPMARAACRCAASFIPRQHRGQSQGANAAPHGRCSSWSRA